MANDFSAGKVYVQVLPSLDNWRARVQKQMNDALAGIKGKVDVEIALDTKGLAAEAARVRREIDRELNSVKTTVAVKVDLDAKDALAKVTRLRRGISALRDKTVTVDVNVNNAAALAGVASSLKGITQHKRKVDVGDGGSIDILNSRMQRLTALAVAASGAIGGLGAGVLALAAASVTVVPGLITVAAGIAAITGAMKAQSDASRQAGQAVAQEAAQQLSAANQVANAQDAIASASRNVASARRDAAESVRTALLAQDRAEAQLLDTQVQALRAQEALTQARRDAARSIEDLANESIDDALAQREAIFKLEDAQKALDETKADAGASERERAEAQLTFDQAKQHLAEISLAYTRSSADAAEAAKAGVNGSRDVIDAQDSLVDAQRAVNQAQLDASEAARRVERERVEGAERVRDAQQQVVQAQRQLNQAQAASAVQSVRQGEAQEKLAEALDKLTPQSLNLIRYLRAQSGEWQLLTQASQGFAPGLQSALQTLQPYFGDLNSNVRTLSGSFGEFLDVLADGMVEFKPFFDQIAGASVTLFPRFGESLNHVAYAAGVLTTDLIPLADNALDVVDAFADVVQGWSPFIAEASGPLLQSLEDIIRNLDFLGPLLVAIAGPAGNLTSTLVSGLRAAFLNMMPALKPFLDACIHLVETLTPLIGDAGNLAGAFMNALLPTLKAVSLALSPLVDFVGVLSKLVAGLPPQLTGLVFGFFAVQKMLGPLRSGFATLATSVGNAATNLATFAAVSGGPTSAAGRLAGAGQRLSGVFSKLSTAIPLVGTALFGVSAIIDLFNERSQRHSANVNKMADIYLRGGKAAQNLREQVDKYGKQLGYTSAEIDAAAQQQSEGLTDVEVAQGRVNQARLEWDNAVRDHGTVWATWKGYKDRYQGALGQLKVAQDNAAQSSKTYTERLQEQQDQLLAMTDANIAKQRAGLQLQKAQLRLGQVRADPKATAEDVLEAQLDLASAQSHYVATATAAAAATAKANHVQNEAAATTRGTNDALIELIRTQGASLPPSILSMIAGMSEAEKAFYGLTVQVDATGKTILSLPGAPGQPPVQITFVDNIDHIKERVVELASFLQAAQTYVWEHLAKIALQNPVPTNTLDPHVFEPTGKFTPAKMPDLPWLNRATGGAVPGRGNTDSVSALLTPGEYVFSKPAVNRLGLSYVDSLHQAARYAEGGLVSPLRFATGGLVGNSFGVSANTGALIELVRVFGALTGVSGPFAASLDSLVVPALQDTLATSDALSQQSQMDWSVILSSVEQSASTITSGPLASLIGALAAINAAITNTAVVWATQWSAIQEYAASPVRWTLMHPFNEGLVAAWNVIDTMFAVGKPLTPLAIPFATGGVVTGGKAGKDSVLAYLMPGEFVAPVEMVRQIGMRNLEAARRAILHGGSAEGLIPGYEAGGAVGKALTFAAAQQGKPYIWGGVGPDGFDCSGLMSAIANVALGQYPFARRFTTADFAPGRGAGGFLPGTGSSFAVGVSDSHMAGTLAGHNIESTTKNGFSGVRLDGDASGALDGQFTKGAFYLPQLGGTFVPGPTGGEAFDWTRFIADNFTGTRNAIASITPLFGQNTLAAGAGAELTRMVDTIIGWSQLALAASVGGRGSGPIMEQVRGVAARYGWGEGPQWEALSTLIGHESGWDPNAQNPVSSAFGLFQFLQSTWDTLGVAKTNNPALQAEAGMRYIQGRYGDPAKAWDFWSKFQWYDDGGYLPPGLSLAYNATSRPEPVLSPDQWQAIGSGAGGSFTGSLYLDSGEFLGKVQGEIAKSNNAIARSISRRTRV